MTAVSLQTLANEIDLLFADYSNIEDAFFCLSAVSGYKNVHDAPQSVQDAESDITYLQSTLNIIEKLFSAEKHTFNLQNPKDILSLHAITIPLETNLVDLHAVLQTWPNPPTVQATELFDTMHSRAVRDLGKRIREAQLKFAVWLSESSTLPSSLDAGLEAVSETTTTPNEHHVENVELENANETTWTKLNELLKTMPATLRLSHLLKKLDELIVVTSKSQLPRLVGFNDDVKQIQEVVKMLDQRLLVENHFATAVRDEIHRIVDVEIKLLLHELKVLPPHSQTNGPIEPSESNEHPYDDSPIHHFLKDHQVIFGMLLVFLAGVRETQGKEEHEEKVVIRDEGNEEVEILRDELYENAVAAVLERIAVHSGAANSWFEVQRRAGR